MNILNKIFGKKKDTTSELAEFLKMDVQAMASFERAYSKYCLDTTDLPDINSRQAAAGHARITETTPDYENLSNKIIDELIARTETLTFDGKKLSSHTPSDLPDDRTLVTNDDLRKMPESQRPMLTGSLMSVDIDTPSSNTVIEMLKRYMETGDRQFYHRFRQGLDILDYDPLMYAMIDTNPNSMSHWLPAIAETAVSHGFFKIPKTVIAHMPMTVLQLTRKEFQQLTPATFDILNRYCMKIFSLDVNKDYFIKTGTYSSKFDFRNAHVHGEKEVRELGEYLLFIHHDANAMASSLASPAIYGVSTTTEWVVREFIEDKEDNPTIYKGMPLHTEYRVFVDFDTDSVLAAAPYWEPATMKKRFGENRDLHDAHDGVIYQMHEDTLMRRYNENKDRVAAEISKFIPDVALTGQWSVDVMQNGDDFYIIDMALAENSAFYSYVPEELRRPSPENWLPDTKSINKILTTDN